MGSGTKFSWKFSSQCYMVNFAFFSSVLSRLNCTHSGMVLACSKRSDSGEWCGVEKAMKSRGGLGREVRERL